MILLLGLSPAAQRVWVLGAVERGGVNRTDQVLDWPSGKGTNAARTARVLGSPVRLIAFAGGASGRVYAEGLEREGLDTVAIPTRAPTRYATTLLEADSATATELVQNARPVSAEEAEAARRAFLAELDAARVTVLTGTVPPGVPAGLYGELVARARTRGIPAIVDAQGELLLEAMEAGPFLVKPNRRELLRALDLDARDEAAYLAALREALARGPQWVAASEGARGVVLAGPEGILRLRPPRIDPVNPIGSGDAMAGGIAHGLLEGMDVPEAVRLGVACGTANALTLRNGLIRPEDVERLALRIEVERLA